MWKSWVASIALMGIGVFALTLDSSRISGQAPPSTKDKKERYGVNQAYLNEDEEIADEHEIENHKTTVKVKIDQQLTAKDASKVWIDIVSGATPLPPFPGGTPATFVVKDGNYTIWTRPDIRVHDNDPAVSHKVVISIYYDEGLPGTGDAQILYQRKVYTTALKTARYFRGVALNGQPVKEGATLDLATAMAPNVFTVTARKMSGVHATRMVYKYLPASSKGPFQIDKQLPVTEAMPAQKADPKSRERHWIVPAAASAGDNTLIVWAVYPIKGAEAYQFDSLRFHCKGKK